jgi:hypothetical protein
MRTGAEKIASHRHKVIVALLMLALPLTAVLVCRESSWICRACAVGYFLAALTAGALAASVFPGRFLISGRGKLALPQYSLQRRIGESVLRLVAIAFVIFLAAKLVQFTLDLKTVVSRGGLERHVGQITKIRGNWLSSWCYEVISLEETTGQTSEYGLFFHPRRLQLRARYSISVLPRTRLVMTTHKTDS